MNDQEIAEFTKQYAALWGGLTATDGLPVWRDWLSTCRAEVVDLMMQRAESIRFDRKPRLPAIKQMYAAAANLVQSRQGHETVDCTRCERSGWLWGILAGEGPHAVKLMTVQAKHNYHSLQLIPCSCSNGDWQNGNHRRSRGLPEPLYTQHALQKVHAKAMLFGSPTAANAFLDKCKAGEKAPEPERVSAVPDEDFEFGKAF